MLGLAGVGVFAIGLAAVVRNAPDADSDAPARLVDTLGLTLVVPVAALLVATATLGQLRGEGSLVYVWLRPVSRASIAIAAWSAAMLITLCAAAVPLAVSAAVAGGGSELILATGLACALGLAAYNGLFVLLGLLTRHAAIWGLGYILVWEGVLAALGSGINTLAVRNYTRSLVESVGGADLPLANASTPTAIAVLVGVAVIAVALTGVRLAHTEVD